PGEDRRRAVDRGMAEPALGGGHVAARDLRSALARERSDHDLAQALVCGRQVEVRGKQGSRLGDRRVDQLRDREDLDPRIGLLEVCPGEGGIGRSQVDADCEPQRHSCLTENSSFQARSPCETSKSSSVPTSVTWERRWTGSTSPGLPSAAGSVVSMAGSSSSSSTSSITAPGASSRRRLEAKKRKDAVSPITAPTSSCGRSTVLPSSMPKGARQTARTGGANPGTAGA